MEGIFIVFVIISVIVSIIGAAAKQAKKSSNPQQNRSYFPPLSVDTPQDPSAFRPIERYYSGPKNIQSAGVEECEGSITFSTEGTGQEGTTSLEEADYTLTEISLSEDTSIEKRSPEADLTLLRAEALKKGREAQSVIEEVTTANRVKLFDNQDEFVKAVIYSEILKPRFKQ